MEEMIFNGQSATVSVAEVKTGGLFFQHMCMTRGNTMGSSSPERVGKMTPSFGMSSILIVMQ